MAKNFLRERIRRGEVVLGMGILSASTDFVEIAARAGFDFIYLDREFTATGWDKIKRMIAGADIYNVPTIVRVERNDSNTIGKSLTLGAKGILVPHVCTKEDAIKVLESARFFPEGSRGAESSARSAGFAVKDWPRYVAKSNRETLVSIMIEDKEAVDNIDEILSVEGVDAICFGALDYSFSIGKPGKRSGHGPVQETFNLLLDKANEKGISMMYTPVLAERVGRAGVDVKQMQSQSARLQSLIDRGARILIVGDDMGIFQQGCADILDAFENMLK